MKLKMMFAVLSIAVLATVPAIADHHGGGDHDHAHGDHSHDAGGAMPAMGPPAELAEINWLIGDWEATTTFRMGPEAPWTEGTAVASCEAILGGGALRQHFKSEMMGMAFEGYYTMTYDREQSRYEATWIDGISCRESGSHGGFVDGNLVLTGADLHGGTEMQMRFTTVKESDDAYTWVMEQSFDGENWFKSMKMKYTRVTDAR